MAVDYDSVRVPSTYSALAGIQPQARPQVFEPASVKIEPSRSNKQAWLRTDNGVASQTAGFVALIGASSTAASGAVGEVWLTYVVELTNPRTPTPVYHMGGVGGAGSAGFYRFTSESTESNFITSWAVNPGSPNNGTFAWGWRAPGDYLMQMAAFANRERMNTYVTALDSWLKTIGATLKVSSYYADYVNNVVFRVIIGIESFKKALLDEGTLWTPQIPCGLTSGSTWSAVWQSLAGNQPLTPFPPATYTLDEPSLKQGLEETQLVAQLQRLGLLPPDPPEPEPLDPSDDESVVEVVRKSPTRKR